MSQKYHTLPLSMNQKKRLKKVLNEWLLGKQEFYHRLSNGPGKEDLGMMIHDTNAILSKLDMLNYEKDWDTELGPFLYPNNKKYKDNEKN